MTPRCVVHKFGGSSLADAGCFRRVADIVAERSEPRRAVVVSAMAGVTNALVSAVEMAGARSGNHRDVLEELRRDAPDPAGPGLPGAALGERHGPAAPRAAARNGRNYSDGASKQRHFKPDAAGGGHP